MVKSPSFLSPAQTDGPHTHTHAHTPQTHTRNINAWWAIQTEVPDPRFTFACKFWKIDVMNVFMRRAHQELRV